MILGECKWSKNKVGIDIFYALKEKAKIIRWNNEKREEEYILFSKSGFEKKFDQVEDEVKLIDIEDLKKDGSHSLVTNSLPSLIKNTTIIRLTTGSNCHRPHR